LPEEIRLAEEKSEELKVGFVHIHLKHKEWMQFSEARKRDM